MAFYMLFYNIRAVLGLASIKVSIVIFSRNITNRLSGKKIKVTIEIGGELLKLLEF